MRPSEMDKATFTAAFGAIYEHSPWIAEQAWESGLSADHDSVEGLNAAFGDVIAKAGRDLQLALLRAHPQLACGVADEKALTAASLYEQKGAGLDQCTEAEFAEFGRLNRAYESRFGFPFIIAVKGLDRREILEAFRSRLANTADSEFLTALEQVMRIGAFRLAEAFGRLPENDG